MEFEFFGINENIIFGTSNASQQLDLVLTMMHDDDSIMILGCSLRVQRAGRHLGTLNRIPKKKHVSSNWRSCSHLDFWAKWILNAPCENKMICSFDKKSWTIIVVEKDSWEQEGFWVPRYLPWRWIMTLQMPFSRYYRPEVVFSDKR